LGESTETFHANFECEVVLDIYNGFIDWTGATTSYSGGQKLSPNEKRSKGAVTVANLNDTDGDTVIDNIDNSVIQSNVGRNEIDLIKIEVKKRNPATSLSGNVILQILSGNVKLWGKSTKENPIILSNGMITIPTASLPKVYYVEAISVSNSLRDIKIQTTYNGKTDIVAATAVWLNLTNTWRDNSNSPIPGTSDLPDLDGIELRKSINLKWKSTNDQRYGFGPFFSGSDHPHYSILTNSNKQIGGRILFEFAISPNNAAQLVDVDVTRQRKNRTYTMSNEQTNSTLTNLTDFPWEMNQDNELSNDDKNNISDEDNILKNNKIYSADPPASTILDESSTCFKFSKITFIEFVRVGVKGNLKAFDNFDIVRGSRGSNKFDWHCSYNLRRDAFLNSNSKLVEDNSISSYSFPNKQTGFIGNGSISISVSPSSSTNYYTIMYAKLENNWTIIDENGEFNKIFSRNTNGTSWSVNGNGLTIQILQGNVAFEENDTWHLTVFKSNNKLNEINLSPIDVTINP